MNIVCATDDNFVQHCSIMLVSLLVNNTDVNIYVLTEGLKPENQRILTKEVERYCGKIHMCLVDSDIVEKFPMPKTEGLKHISRATYYRLLISDLLPNDVHKVIYLDCDIIVNGSLQPLWNIDITNYAIAASKQIGSGYEALRLGYPIKYGYFNAGVSIINLDYFRDYNINRELIQYINDNYSKIIYHDQDTLNAVLYDKCLHIMPQWNMTSIVYSYGLNNRGDRQAGKIVCDYYKEKENAKIYKKTPIVLHYVSHPKPWQKGCTHPLYRLYYEYAKQTIHYRNIIPQSYISRLIPILKFRVREVLSSVKQSIYRTDKSRL